MKKILQTAIVCFVATSFAFAQIPVIGTPEWAALHNSIQHNSGPIYTPQNGDDTLTSIYNNTACGLNYVMVSQRLGQRFVPIGLPQPTPFVVNMSPCAIIQQAFLYTEALGVAPSITANLTNPASVTTAYNMTNIGNSVDVCWGMNGTHVWRTDVTASITGPGTYTLSGLPTSTTASMSTVDCEGATLIIIYQDPYASYTGTLKIDDGCHTVIGGTLNHTMTGFSACANSTYANDFMIVGDMQMFTYQLNVNGSPIVQPQWNWWNVIGANTSVTNGQSYCSYDLSGSGDCYTLAVAGLYFQTGCSTCSPSISPISLVTTSLPDNCNGNGSAAVSASGGSGNYTYLWSPGGQTTASVTGLAGGTYTVWVNDGTSCASAQVVVAYNGMNLTMSSIGVSCSGNGSATIAVTGGQGPYTYQWAPSGGTGSTASNLAAGNYSVTVTDNGGCTMTASVNIAANSTMYGNMLITPDSCNTSSGAATMSVYGGIAPYTYLWSPGGQTTMSITGQTAGTHTCVVTDNAGCSITVVNSITNSIVTVVAGGSGTIACGDSIQLYGYANYGNATYSWAPSTGLDNPNVQYPYSTATVTTTYTVTANYGCVSATDTVTVYVNSTNIFGEQICYVTVDTTFNKNVVIWERWSSPTTGYYNIYRESSPGVYTIIHTQPISQFSTYTDMTSNPSVGPDRYKISTVNLCGTESDTSYHHRSIFLTTTPNGPGWDLVWTPYEGLPISIYNIYRGLTYGTMTLLAQVPGTQHAYTDANPPAGLWIYRVEALHPFGGCFPSMRLSTQQTTLNYDGSLSNGSGPGVTGLNENSLLGNSLLIIPNPGNGNFQLNMTLANSQEIEVNVFDNLGRNVYAKNENASAGNFSATMNLSALSSGVYFVQVKTANGIATKRLIIN